MNNMQWIPFLKMLNNRKMDAIRLAHCIDKTLLPSKTTIIMPEKDISR